MTMPTRRRIGTSLAALALVVGLASGCTVGDWRYDSPPAAGVQADVGPVKVRNLMVLADSSGEGLLLGSIFTTQELELTDVAISAEQEGGTFADPVPVDLTGDVSVNDGLQLGGKDSLVEGAKLQEGLLARVMMQFSDGTTAAVEAPVISSEHADYKDAWAQAQA